MSPALQNPADRLIEAIRPMAANLPSSGIISTVTYGRERPGLIPFWAGEGNAPTPDFICDAAIQAMRDGETFYTYTRGIPPLRQAVADYLKRHFEVEVAAERVHLTASGMQAVLHTVQMLVGPGDEVAVVSPVWPNIVSAIHMQEAVAVPVTLTQGTHAWHLDLDHLFDACGPNTRAIFINSPNNPTGWVIEPEDMIRVRDFARERGLWIIADEVYGQFIYDRPRTTSFLEITTPEDRLIVTNTFSKNWSMTGWRVGWMVIPESEALAQVHENILQYSTSGVATFLQHGCITALNQGDAYVKQMVDQSRQGRDLVCEQLGELPRVQMVPPQGAFYLFFRVEGESDSTALARWLIDEANVGLAPGLAFGAGGEEFLRLCFAASKDTLQTGVDRLVRALK